MSAPSLSDLISDAFYEIAVYSPGEPVDPVHVNFGGSRLNALIDAWKAERLTIWRDQRTGPFQLTASTQAYKIGTGATWNTPRPLWIDFAGLYQTVGGGTPTPEYPMTVMTDYQWAKTVTKPLTSSIPTALWYDRDFDTSGFGTINIWPTPTVANQVVLYSPVPVDEFDLVNGMANAIVFPPAFRDFLMYSLALRLASPFGKTPMQMTITLQAQAMERVKTYNLRMNELRVDDALLRKEGGFYNYLNDSFNFR